MTSRIALVAPGQRVSAARDSNLADAVNDLTAGVAPASAALDPAGEAVAVFTITDVSGVELQAVAGVGTPTAGAVRETVRVPPELGELSRDAVTITISDVNNATATDGTTNETWKMLKPYAVGDVIVVFRWSVDGVWVDRNIAGRMWASEPPGGFTL